MKKIERIVALVRKNPEITAAGASEVLKEKVAHSQMAVARKRAAEAGSGGSPLSAADNNAEVARLRKRCSMLAKLLSLVLAEMANE